MGPVLFSDCHPLDGVLFFLSFVLWKRGAMGDVTIAT